MRRSEDIRAPAERFIMVFFKDIAGVLSVFDFEEDT
jgi:hypothetical protein